MTDYQSGPGVTLGPAFAEEPVDRQHALSDSGRQTDPQDGSTGPAPPDHDGRQQHQGRLLQPHFLPGKTWKWRKWPCNWPRKPCTRTSSRVQVGALAPLDEKQAESQAASAESDLLTAQTALAVQENVLKEPAGLSPRRLDRRHARSRGTIAGRAREPGRPGMLARRPGKSGPIFCKPKPTSRSSTSPSSTTSTNSFPELDVLGSYGHNATDPDLRRQPQHHPQRQLSLLFLRPQPDHSAGQQQRALQLQDRQSRPANNSCCNSKKSNQPSCWPSTTTSKPSGPTS